MESLYGNFSLLIIMSENPNRQLNESKKKERNEKKGELPTSVEFLEEVLKEHQLFESDLSQVQVDPKYVYDLQGLVDLENKRYISYDSGKKKRLILSGADIIAFQVVLRKKLSDYLREVAKLLKELIFDISRSHEAHILIALAKLLKGVEFGNIEKSEIFNFLKANSVVSNESSLSKSKTTGESPYDRLVKLNYIKMRGKQVIPLKEGEKKEFYDRLLDFVQKFWESPQEQERSKEERD